jgi:hypothetical protein
MLLTARWTPGIYYGEELGMADGDLDLIRLRRENAGILQQPSVRCARRDENVDEESRQTGSLLQLYRRLLEARRANRARPLHRSQRFGRRWQRALNDSQLYVPRPALKSGCGRYHEPLGLQPHCASDGRNYAPVGIEDQSDFGRGCWTKQRGIERHASFRTLRLSCCEGKAGPERD